MSDRPNILLILTDQQRADTLGLMPHVTSIAAQGVTFTDAITPCPLCLPARAALFTGLYPTQTNMMSNTEGRLTRCDLLEQFRAGGYQINYAGKWHMGDETISQFTDRHGGDDTAIYSAWCQAQGLLDGWMFNDPATRTHRAPSMSTPKTHRQDLPVEKTNEAYITDIATRMIRSRAKDRPFFQVCAYNGPHPPFMIPEPYFSQFDPAEVPEPANFGPNEAEHPAHSSSYYRDLFTDHGTEFEAWRTSYAVYWGFVAMIDHFVGQLLGVLEEEGLRDDTIVVFTSDHGEMLGAHGLWHKMVAFEESIRVPLIVQVPGEAPEIRDTPASLVDLAPTLAGLCGLPPRSDWVGRDLWSHPGRTPQFAMHQPLGAWMKVTDWRMIRSDGYKYVWHRDMAEELFHLPSDPGETANLAADAHHQARKEALAQELGAFLAATNDPLRAEFAHG